MKTAMLLCAGYGTRLKEYTKEIPKPMLPINGKPLLEYTIEHLARLGIKNIIINLHYFAEKVSSYFGDGRNWDIDIKYSYEEKPLGTAGAVKKARKILEKNKDFFVIYGDIISNENYNNLYEFHKKKSDSIATIVIHERENSNSVVEIDDENRVTRFLERPTEKVLDKSQNWVNSGLYCFSNKIFDYIQERDFCDFPKDIFPDLAKEKVLYGYPLTGYRCAIDSIERYKKVEDDLKKTLIFY